MVNLSGHSVYGIFPFQNIVTTGGFNSIPPGSCYRRESSILSPNFNKESSDCKNIFDAH